MKSAAVGLTILAVAVLGLAQEERITSGPEVLNVTQESATIGWATNMGGSSIVHYGTDPANLNQTAKSASVTGTVVHRVVLKNLQPNTTYYFVVESSRGKAR